MLKPLLRRLAFKYRRFGPLYLKVCKPRGEEYATYLKRWNKLHAIGDGCCILRQAEFTDPVYVSLGDNVILSNCTLIGHDGSVAVLARKTGKTIDAVGPIVIKDNVFVGHGATILPGVTIGPDAIVAAGAVVTRDVGPDQIVGGVPAKVIGSVSSLANRLEAETRTLPWYDVLAARGPDYDPAVEPTLRKLRIAHFFNPAIRRAA